VSWPTVIQRIAIGVAATATMGIGSMVLNDHTKVAIHEQDLSDLKLVVQKVPEIDQHILALNGKVDVLNQKLDDAQATRQLVATAKASK